MLDDGRSPGPWQVLFDGDSLEGWQVTPFGGEGEVALREGSAVLPMGSMLTGIHRADGGGLPRTNYEVEVVAARLGGTDFFCGLTLPVGASFATLVLGGWGGAVTGLSCLDGSDASENETTSYRTYEEGRDYTARVRVTPERVVAWLDEELLFDVPVAGRRVELRPEVLLSRPLGVASFATTARVSSVRLRQLFAHERTPLIEPVRVLLLGDSISMGYHDAVVETLGERAVVHRPRNAKGGKANCQGTNHGVLHLEEWLAIDGGDWDVIHFNFGLHDLKRVDPETGKNSKDPSHPQQAPLPRYEAQLRSIVARLLATGARVVFATTTPVPEGVGGPHRAPADPLAYNRVARRVMEEHAVPVHDLYAFAESRLTELQNERDVHFHKEGSRVLAGRVANAILREAGLLQGSSGVPEPGESRIRVPGSADQ